MIKRLLILSLIFILIISFSVPVLATEKPATHEKPHEEVHAEDETGKHEAEHEAEHEEHHGPPLLYFLQWGFLLVIFGLSTSYVRKIRTRGRSHHEGLTLAYILTFLILICYALNYHPSMHAYHEPSVVGFLKFGIMILAGAFVTVYGILGRHEEHEEHEEHVPPHEGHASAHKGIASHDEHASPHAHH
ncbi:MAG: hypothetical protein QMD66_00450 [Actinomycetota bacterium]|nr:hypothetical protein [Actinomycetota bacterium]